MIAIFKNLTERQAQTYGLLLAAVSIQYDISKSWLGWGLWVNDEDYDAALDLIEEYLEEHPVEESAEGLKPYAGKMRGYGFWGALVILVVHVAIYRVGNSKLFIQSLGASADAIMQGEIFRSVTALLIHANHPHLVGNMVGIAIFGSAVCSLVGWGAGWLLILLAGICGNLLNALLHGSGHLSVGASTAVFGAIGFLAAVQFIRKFRTPGQGLRALMPLGGGLALLAILGSGPHTDIMAHLFGFLSGCFFGLIYSFRIRHPLPPKYQFGFLLLTIGIIIGAWFIAPIST